MQTGLTLIGFLTIHKYHIYRFLLVYLVQFPLTRFMQTANSVDVDMISACFCCFFGVFFLFLFIFSFSFFFFFFFSLHRKYNITHFVSHLVENMFSHDNGTNDSDHRLKKKQTLIHMYIGVRRVTHSIDFSIQTRLVLEIKELHGLARCLIFKGWAPPCGC